MNHTDAKQWIDGIDSLQFELSKAKEDADCCRRRYDQLRMSAAMMLDALFLYPEYLFDELSDQAHRKTIDAIKALTSALEDKT